MIRLLQCRLACDLAARYAWELSGRQAVEALLAHAPQAKRRAVSQALVPFLLLSDPPEGKAPVNGRSSAQVHALRRKAKR